MKYLLLADPNSKIWNFAKAIIKKLGKNFELGKIEIYKFNDGEICCQIKENVRAKNCFFICDSSKNPQEWFVEILLVNDALKRASAAEVTDILPYMRFSRQDRMQEPRTPISASVIAECISLNANRIITTDLHSDQIQGFYKIPFDNLHSFPIVINYLKRKYKEFLKDVVIVSPDIGGTRRARGFARRLRKEIVIIDKRRQRPGEAEAMYVVGNVKNKNVLIVDDIIDTGGTMSEAYKLLKKEGAKKIFAYCTHGVFSGNAKEKLKVFNKIFTTDTIPSNATEQNIEVISLVGLYAEVIKRISEGLSISELFK